MQLQDLSHWWTEKQVREKFAPETKRELLRQIEGDLGRRQIQVIAGLRRTGKSTIIYQMIKHLIKSKTNPLQIIYCSFDEPELQEKRIEDILKEYSVITGRDYKKESVYLFLDEVQKSKNWVSSVKLIYDNLRNIKMVISGSASLNLMVDAKKSLAGRAIYYELKPLSFKEFLHFKGINAGNFLLYREMLEKEFGNYLLRPFPEIINEKDVNFIKSYIRSSVIEPIILKDIPKEFEDVDIILLEKLVNIFMSNPGQCLSFDDLAKELGRAKKTLYTALSYLEFSFLIRKILNFRPSIRAASRKLSKIYPYHPCLGLPFGIQPDKFAENLVLFELDAKYYWREKEKEIDFLKETVPVEVKYKSDVKKDDLRWVHYFMQKYGKTLKIKKAFVVTKDIEKEEGDIMLIPLAKFCFQGI
ncbi:MAG: ATP-binding protein [Nanoarchaeota archaeon]|nr:ATP-binding protein [Nanoarchaeota archaeon]